MDEAQTDQIAADGSGSGPALESRLERLTEIVDTLEADEVELDRALALFVQAAHAGRIDGPTPLALLDEVADVVESISSQFDIGIQEPVAVPSADLAAVAGGRMVPVRELIALYAAALTADHLARTTDASELADVG